jgi:predicted amidohydrolase
MKITIAQIAPKLNKHNVEKHKRIIKESDADIVVFPELSLNGYMLQDKVVEDAWSIEELATLGALSMEKDIILGAALKSNQTIYNSALYFSGGTLQHVHHKNHLPNYGMFEEARFFTEGKEITTTQTKFGNIATVVCEDLWRVKTIDRLVQMMPDVIVVIANSPARDFSDDGLLIKAQWESILKTTALLSHAHVIFVNRVGFEDGFGFWGGSMVITPDSQISLQLPLFDEKIETITINQGLYATQAILYNSRR